MQDRTWGQNYRGKNILRNFLISMLVKHYLKHATDSVYGL